MNRLDIESNMVEMVVAALIVIGTIVVNIVQRVNAWINEKRLLVNRPEREEEARAPTEPRGATDPPSEKAEDPGAILLRELERALRGETQQPAKPKKADEDQRGFPQTAAPYATPLETMQREADTDRDARQLSGQGAPQETKTVLPPAEPQQPRTEPVRNIPAPPAAPRQKPVDAYAPRRNKRRPGRAGSPKRIAESSAYDLHRPANSKASLAVLRNRTDVLKGIVAHEILSPPRARRAPAKRAF